MSFSFIYLGSLKNDLLPSLLFITQANPLVTSKALSQNADPIALPACLPGEGPCVVLNFTFQSLHLLLESFCTISHPPLGHCIQSCVLSLYQTGQTFFDLNLPCTFLSLSGILEPSRFLLMASLFNHSRLSLEDSS